MYVQRKHAAYNRYYSFSIVTIPNHASRSPYLLN